MPAAGGLRGFRWFCLSNVRKVADRQSESVTLFLIRAKRTHYRHQTHAIAGVCGSASPHGDVLPSTALRGHVGVGHTWRQRDGDGGLNLSRPLRATVLDPFVGAREIGKIGFSARGLREPDPAGLTSTSGGARPRFFFISPRMCDGCLGLSVPRSGALRCCGAPARRAGRTLSPDSPGVAAGGAR